MSYIISVHTIQCQKQCIMQWIILVYGAAIKTGNSSGDTGCRWKAMESTHLWHMPTRSRPSLWSLCSVYFDDNLTCTFVIWALLRFIFWWCTTTLAKLIKFTYRFKMLPVLLSLIQQNCLAEICSQSIVLYCSLPLQQYRPDLTQSKNNPSWQLDHC